MHAKGSGAFGSFTVTHDISQYTKAKKCSFNPFDLTKVWAHSEYPLMDVGVLELNKNPENYFADVEQAAFNPANVVPGIGFSPDRMLQGRLFPYGDAQRYRLGVNHNHIPVNRARCPVTGFHRDGQMRVDGNYGATLGYEPNSYGEWQDQPGDLYNLMNSEQKKVLHENTARAMGDAPREIKIRHIGNCQKADKSYGQGVANALGIPLSEVQ